MAARRPEAKSAALRALLEASSREGPESGAAPGAGGAKSRRPRARRPKAGKAGRERSRGLELPPGFDLEGFLGSVDAVFARHGVSADEATRGAGDAPEEPAPPAENAPQGRAEAVFGRPAEHVRDAADVLALLEVVNRQPLFASLSLRQRVEICRVVGRREVPRGRPVFSRGDDADEVYVVLRGSVRVDSIVRARAGSRFRRAESDEALVAVPETPDMPPPAAAAAAPDEDEDEAAADGDGSDSDNGSPLRRDATSRSAASSSSSSADLRGPRRQRRRPARRAPSDASSGDGREVTEAEIGDKPVLLADLLSASGLVGGPDSPPAASSQRKLPRRKKRKLVFRQVARLLPGDTLGERCVLECSTRDSNVVSADDDTQLLVLGKWAYHEHVRGASVRVLNKVRGAFHAQHLPGGPPLPLEGGDELFAEVERLAGLAGAHDSRSVLPAAVPRLMRNIHLPVKMFQAEMYDPERYTFDGMPPEEAAAKRRARAAVERTYVSPFYLEPGLTMAGRVHKASLFIEDAMAGRSIRPHRTGRAARRVDAAMNSSWYDSLMFLIVLAHMSLVVWEAPSFRDMVADKYQDRLVPLLVTEWVCITLYLAELAWIMHDLGLWWFFGSRKRALRLLLVLAIAADVAGITLLTATADGDTVEENWLRYSRVLRPMLLLFRSRHMRRMYLLAVRVLPRLLELVVMFAGIIVFYAVIGLFLFSDNKDLYNAEAWAARAAPYESCSAPPPGQASFDPAAACPALPDYIFESFDGYPEAMLSLFVLLSTSNWPVFGFPAYAVQHFYTSYFVTFLIVSVFFFSNLLVAVMYDSYRAIQVSLIRQDARAERQALGAAFSVLDIHDAGVCTYDTFRLLMRYKQPGLEEYQVHAIFVLLDVDGDGVIDRDEFMEIVDAMFVRITKRRGLVFTSQRKRDQQARATANAAAAAVGVVAGGGAGAGGGGGDSDSDGDGAAREVELSVLPEESRMGAEESVVPLPMASTTTVEFRWGLGAVIEWLVESRGWDALMFLAICADTVALLSLTERSQVFSDINVGLTLYFAFELLMSAKGLGLQRFWAHAWKKFDLTVTILQLVGVTAAVELTRDFWIDNNASEVAGLRFFGLLRFIRVISYVTSMRWFLSDEYMASLTATVVRMIPLFFGMVVALVSVVFYVFAVVGMELFRGHGDLDGVDRCHDGLYMQSDVTARFCDASTALLTLFQIICDASWHDVMYSATAGYGFSTSFFFVLFHFLSALVMLNLLISTFLDAFLVERAIRTKANTLSSVLGDGAAMAAEPRGEMDDSPPGSAAGAAATLAASRRRSSDRLGGGGFAHADKLRVSVSTSSLGGIHRRLNRAYGQSLDTTRRDAPASGDLNPATAGSSEMNPATAGSGSSRSVAALHGAARTVESVGHRTHHSYGRY